MSLTPPCCACAVPLLCLLQLLGMKGASAETNIWKIRVQLMKPVTWIPLIWGAHSPSEGCLCWCRPAALLCHSQLP